MDEGATIFRPTEPICRGATRDPLLVDRTMPVAIADMNVLDVLFLCDLRQDFVRECENLLLFDGVYDQALARLKVLLKGASQSLSEASLGEFLQAFCPRLRRKTISVCIRLSCLIGTSVSKMPKSAEFFQPLASGAELYPFVRHVVCGGDVLFTTLLQSYVGVQSSGKAYQQDCAPQHWPA